MTDPETVGQLLDALPPRDHNAAPLAEVLVEETAPLAQRAAALTSAAGRAVVADDDTARRATLLIAQLRDCDTKLEAARKERKAPVLETGRTIDAHFNSIKGPLATARAAVTKLLDDWRKSLREEHPAASNPASATERVIETDYGIKASSRKVVSVTVVDFQAAGAHCLSAGIAALEVQEAVQRAYERFARAGARDLPGAVVEETTTTVVR